MGSMMEPLTGHWWIIVALTLSGGSTLWVVLTGLVVKRQHEARKSQRSPKLKDFPKEFDGSGETVPE